MKKNHQHVLVDVAQDNSKPGIRSVILCFRRDDGEGWGYAINLPIAAPIEEIAKCLSGKDLIKMAAGLPEKPAKK